jgi:glutamate/tyrosine decarboxylase-like PLP-dependent enzyme
VTDWPGGFYVSPTFAGSRPGALIAVAWAAMVSMGENGYLESAKRILETTDWLKQEIRKISDLQLIGDPPFMVTFQSESLNVYQVMEYMTERNWGLSGLHLPPSVHLCVTQRHTQEGVKERFMKEIKEAVAYVKENPQAPEGMGPIYGMAATIETREMVKPVLDWYLDMLHNI